MGKLVVFPAKLSVCWSTENSLPEVNKFNAWLGGGEFGKIYSGNNTAKPANLVLWPGGKGL